MAVYRVTKKKTVEKPYEISCRDLKLFSHKIMFGSARLYMAL